MQMKSLFCVPSLLCVAVASVVESASLPPPPLILAHRGASGYLPEHSLAAYELAMELQADYVEPDLVLTKDQVFVAVHDLLLDDISDIEAHPEFASRKTTRVVEGANTTGYFVSDFDYAELQTLGLKQRLEGRPTRYNGVFKIPTFGEIVDLVYKYNAQHFNNTKWIEKIGVYPELKHPEYHRQYLGVNVVDKFGVEIDGLVAKYPTQVSTSSPSATPPPPFPMPLILQCFDASALKEWSSRTRKFPLIQLLDTRDQYTKKALEDIKTYADGVGPGKDALVGKNLQESRERVAWAHRLGLQLHPYTFRLDYYVLEPFTNVYQNQSAKRLRHHENLEPGLAEQEYFFCCLGIDAAFSEFPDRTKQMLEISKERKESFFSPGRWGSCRVDCNAYSF